MRGGGPSTLPGLREHVRSGLLWSAVQQWGVQAIRLGVLLVLARLVQPAAFGTFALASTIVGLVQLLHGQGLTAAVLLRHEMQPRHTGAALLALVGSGFAAALLLAAVAGHLKTQTIPGLAPLLRVLCVVLPLNALSGVPVALWRRGLHFRKVAVVTTGSQLAASAIAVVLAWRGFGIWSLAARMIAESVLMVVLTLPAVPWRTVLQATWPAYLQMLRFGLPTAGSNLLALGRNRLDELIIGGTLGLEALGYYALARRETEGISSLLPAVVGNAMVPLLGRVQRDGGQARLVLLRGIGLIGALTLPVLAAMAGAANGWVPLLLGQKWLPVVPLVQGFAVIAATRALVGFNLTTLPAVGHPGKRLGLELVTSAISLAAIFAAAPFGIRAVVFASAACLLLLTPVELHWMSRWLPLRLYDQVAALRTPALVAAALWLCVIGAARLGIWLPQPALRLLLQSGMTLVAVFFCYRRLPPFSEGR